MQKNHGMAYVAEALDAALYFFWLMWIGKNEETSYLLYTVMNSNKKQFVNKVKRFAF